MAVAEHKLKGFKRVSSRWLDYKKWDEASGRRIVRSRLVIQEIAWEELGDKSQGTPPTWTMRIVISLPASKGDPSKARTRKVGRHDVSVAFFHAAIGEPIAALPPKDLRRVGRCWKP